MIYQLGARRPTFPDADYFIADSAAVIGSVILGADASIWYQCVLRGDNDDLIVGAGTNIQDGSVLHTDPGLKLVVGAGCTVGHLVMLHGCEIGDNCIVGIKSVILNRARIGRNSIVGANSLVTEGKQFPDGVLIVGAPAKVARELTSQEIQFNTVNAQHYVENFKRFKKDLKLL